MYIKRRVLAYAAWIMLGISLILLANFTAPNPTGRRYSSERPIITGTPGEIGESGEAVLSKDLGLPNNNDADQKQCVCGKQHETPPAGQCNVCLVNIGDIRNFRKPDFVSNSLLGESKNVIQLTASGDVYDQITDMAQAAQSLEIPLWVYVRTDTHVAREYRPIVEATGGGVVYYFAVPGYVDLGDVIALIAALFSLIIFVYLLMTRQQTQSVQESTSPPPPKTKSTDDPLKKAADAVDKASRYVDSGKDRTRHKIDIENARYDE